MTLHELQILHAKTMADDCAEILLAEIRRQRRPITMARAEKLARRMRALGAAAVEIAPVSEEAA